MKTTTVAIALLFALVGCGPALTYEEMAASYCMRTVADCTAERLDRHEDLVAIGCEPESYEEMRCLYESDAPFGACVDEGQAVTACERRGCEAEYDAQWACWVAANDAGIEDFRAACPDEGAAVEACLDARAE